jgi:D-alanyl-lipoteichoic acid acyltransferase DltB (MBOAT superfamily)
LPRNPTAFVRDSGKSPDNRVFTKGFTMGVPSWQFLAFVLLGAVVFNAVSARLWREAVWLVLNLTFVWSLSGTIALLLPLAGFLTLGFLGAEVARKRWATWPAIGLILALFIWLKRYSFIPDQLMLPPGFMLVGLSYVFFRVMHLIIDAGQGAERIGVIRYVNFTLNFPAFISGPIQRREDYEAHDSLPLTVPDISLAAWRMILGAFKVLVLSAVLLAWQHDMIGWLGSELSFGQRVVAGALVVVLYPLFLYMNFSGYTDFVIGVARLFRLGLPENFDHPFSAVNFINFWSRWHISLSQWLRSYVFSPLLMTWMRRFKSARSKQYPSVVALFVTFFLVGAWHGPTSAFLFFGLLQGGGVAGNRMYQVILTRWLTQAGCQLLSQNPVYRSLARGLTFTWFAFTLLWFWAGWSEIGALGTRLAVTGSIAAFVVTVCSASVVLAVPDILGAFAGKIESVSQSRYTRTMFASAMIFVMAVATIVLNISSPDIVYKQF